VLDHSRYRALRYFPALDGLRAISILLVIVLHTNPVLWSFVNGGMGVHIFFTISGYLITTLALREEDAHGAISLKAFYIRRACRILPLYYLVLAFYVALVIGMNYHGHRQLLSSAMPYYLTYTNELAPDSPDMPFAHSWSLGVEEKFYLLWPALAFMLWRQRLRWRFAGTAAIVVLPPLLDALHLLPFDVRRYGLPLYNSYNGILIGCLLAFALHDKRSYAWLARLASGWRAWAVPTLFLLMQFVGLRAGVHILFYSLSVALLMVPILVGRAAWTRPLTTRPMVTIGLRSYAVYLIHQICLSVSAALASRLTRVGLDPARLPITQKWSVSLLILLMTCAASLLLAAGLNRWIERPCIDFGRGRTRALTGSEPVAARVA